MPLIRANWTADRRALITLRISGRPFFRRADDVAPSFQRLMHQLAQKTENNLLGAIFSIGDFPINVWNIRVAFMHLPSPPLSFRHLRRHYFRQTINVWLNNATLIGLEKRKDCMTHSSNPVTGYSSAVSEQVSSEHDVFCTKAHVKAVPISAAPDEDAIGGVLILDAPSICVGGLPTEEMQEDASDSAFAQLGEVEHTLYQFDMPASFFCAQIRRFWGSRSPFSKQCRVSWMTATSNHLSHSRSNSMKINGGVT